MEAAQTTVDKENKCLASQGASAQWWHCRQKGWNPGMTWNIVEGITTTLE
jgi:hypothetical protein